MPHFTLHHSANLSYLDVNRCLAAVNAALAESGHFEEIDIKSRAFQAEQFLVGVEARGRAFVAGTFERMHRAMKAPDQAQSDRLLAELFDRARVGLAGRPVRPLSPPPAEACAEPAP